MSTAADIITAAFLKVGVDSPTSAQTASALISLNNLLSFLGADMLEPVVTTETFSLVASDSEYTIGSAGQWDTVRPIKVLTCFLRSDSYDYPVKIIGSRDYALIWDKSFSGRPTQLYFVPEYPLAKIIFNTSPDAAYDAHFTFLKNFTEFASTATSFTLPEEYKQFFVYNLAVSVGEDWDRQISKTVYAESIRTREVVDRLNAAAKTVPRVRFDFGGIGRLNDQIASSISSGDTNLIDGGSF